MRTGEEEMMERDELNMMFGVTEDQLTAEAAEYEDGLWDESSFGQPTPGRPRLYDEDMQTVTLRLPRSRIVAVEEAASRLGQTRSQFMREAIDARLVIVG